MSFGILSPLLDLLLNIVSVCADLWDALFMPLGDWISMVLSSDGVGLNINVGSGFFDFLNCFSLVSFFFGVGFFIILILKLIKLLPFT